MIPAQPSPPGAPIGDFAQDWLARPAGCAFDEMNPGAWVFFTPEP